ncbi:MAG: hypothetical protein JKX68_06040 [Flavobacteriales bacterium]|nr:hypothetical protein [Flavobacteriales bacterium]
MKTIIAAVVIFSSSFLNGNKSYGTININEKLQDIVVFEKGTLPIEKNSSEFVKISFKINEEGFVEILEMNYSDELIKTKLVEKLSKMKIEEEHDSEEIYNYNFTFKKL